MNRVMKAIVVPRIGEFDYTDRPVPQPAAGEVLVRVSVAGLCRTDLKLIEVGHRDLDLPRIPAEEVVGTVCELGPGVPDGWINQRVYLYPGTSCGSCPACAMGAGNLCDGMRIMGFHRDGGFAQYVAAPVESLTSLPEKLAEEHAVFAEPLSCCLNALELANVERGDRVGIWGAGPAGTLLARAARSKGADVTVFEPDERRCRLANGFSQPPADAVFDVVIPAVGSPDAYRQALQHLAPRGRIVAFSGLARDDANAILDLNALHYLEQTCVGAYGCSYRHGVEALQAIASGDVIVDDLISHRLLLSDMADALDLVRQRAGMKILIYPTDELRTHYYAGN